MSIRVTCQCGQSFAAKPHLAGKQVKCPVCAKPLAIPAVASQQRPQPQPTNSSDALAQGHSPSAGWSQSSGVQTPFNSYIQQPPKRKVNWKPAVYLGGGLAVVSLVAAVVLVLVNAVRIARSVAENPIQDFSNYESWEEIEKEARSVPAAATLPDGQLVYQPVLFWEESRPTFQGTGFLSVGPSGDTVGITSAHYFDFEGPRLRKVAYLDIATSEPVEAFTRSLGPPGRPSTGKDLRDDYMILSSDSGGKQPYNRPALQLDPRTKPDVGERIWLPNKDINSPRGFTAIEGTVVESDTRYSAVIFDQQFELQSQSGSPLISQRTGKVIGTLSGGGELTGRMFILVAPAKAILDAMKRAQETPQLRDVVGKR